MRDRIFLIHIHSFKLIKLNSFDYHSFSYELQRNNTHKTQTSSSNT